MLSVHQQGSKLILIHLEAEQNAQAHVVDAALHGPVHGLGVVGIVTLGAGGMEPLIALLVIGLLEEDVGADARVLEPAVVLHGRRGDVHVHAADGAVLVVDGVNRFDALEDVLDGVVLRVLSRLDRQALVAHVLQRDDLLPDLLLRQLAARDGSVLHVIRTVHAAVYAVVGQVQRRKDDDAVAVERLLDLTRDLVDLLHLLRDLAGQQHARLPMGQARAGAAGGRLPRARLFKDRVNQRFVVLVRLGVGQRLADLAVVNKFLRMQGPGIVACHGSLPFFGSDCLPLQMVLGS